MTYHKLIFLRHSYRNERCLTNVGVLIIHVESSGALKLCSGDRVKVKAK